MSNMNSKAVNFHQDEIYKKLQAYVKITDGSLPFDSENGLCSGLVAYALYCEFLGIEDEFIDQLNYVLNWDPKHFLESGQDLDTDMEVFINDITALHFDNNIRYDEDVEQRQLEKSLTFLSNKVQIKSSEITFVFDEQKLAVLINEQAINDRLIRIENGFHAIGLVFKDGVYKLYNFENPQGPQIYLTATKVADVIFKGLSAHCHSKKHIALNIRVSDRIDSAAKFPTLDEYATPLLAHPQYKKYVLQHPNIFHLAARMGDYPLMDLLFAQGYAYMPWQMDRFPEINDAIINNDKRMLKYLLEHGISPNARTAKGMTPVGEAIAYNRIELLFELLEAGANPNAEVRKDLSSLALALAKKSPEAIVLLLAFELNPDAHELSNMRIHFSAPEIDAIKNLAVAFNAKILGTQDNLDIGAAGNKQLITFLHHLRMQARIGKGPDKTALATILKQAATRFFALEPNNLDAFSEKAEMYNLLKYFKIGSQTRAALHMGRTLDSVVRQILNMPYGYYSPEARQSIATTLKTIDDILGFRSEMKVSFYLRHKLYQAKRKIESHVAAYHTLQSFLTAQPKHLLFGSNNCQLVNEVEFSQDIRPEFNFRIPYI